MTKCDSIDEVMAAIRKASRADDKGDWYSTVELDVTGCFRPSGIFRFDTGRVLLADVDSIPLHGEVSDGEYTGEYDLVDLTVRSSRIIAYYTTIRDGSEQAAYAPGARK